MTKFDSYPFFVENTGFSLWIDPPSTAYNHQVDTSLKRKKKTLETFENAIFMNSVSDMGNNL